MSRDGGRFLHGGFGEVISAKIVLFSFAWCLYLVGVWYGFTPFYCGLGSSVGGGRVVLVKGGGVVKTGVGDVHRSGRLSARRMSRHSNLDVRRVRHVRNGVSFPSLTPLVGVTHMLNMHLNAFLSSRSRLNPIVYHGGSDGSAGDVNFDGGSDGTHGRVRCRSLSRSGSNHRVRPFLVSITPDRRKISFILSARRKRRFVCMLRNVLRVGCNGGACVLRRNSDVCCSSVITRRMRTTTSGATGVLKIVCAPCWSTTSVSVRLRSGALNR